MLDSSTYGVDSSPVLVVTDANNNVVYKIYDSGVTGSDVVSYASRLSDIKASVDTLQTEVSSSVTSGASGTIDLSIVNASCVVLVVGVFACLGALCVYHLISRMVVDGRN